jgi:inhibitor of cysteine peptidase
MRVFAIAPLALAFAGSATGQNADSGGPDLTPPVVVSEMSVPVDLRVGQLLEIRLPVRGGTGYSWQSAGNVPPSLGFVGQHSLPRLPDNSMPGGPETQLLIYRAVASGTGQLKIVYQRPWETGLPPARVVRYQVTVRG